MKRLQTLKFGFLLPLSINLSLEASAQIFTEEHNINDLKNVEYVVVEWAEAGGRNYAKLSFDDVFGYKIIKDDKGQKLIFKTRAALYNHFYKNGWEFVSSECEPISCRHIFKRRKMLKNDSNTEGG
jgi:hypothetical protein